MAKGQTEIVSAVLLMGIMVGLVIVAYFWAGPLISKQQDIVKVDNTNRFARTLNDNIKSVAKGGGREIMRGYEIPGELSIVEAKNKLVLEFKVTGTVIQPGEQILIIGDNNQTVAPLGAEPGFLTVKSEKLDGNTYTIKMELVYRELVTATDSYLLKINTVGRPKIGGGGHIITIEGGSSEDIIGGGSGGRTLHVTNILLRLE